MRLLFFHSWLGCWYTVYASFQCLVVQRVWLCLLSAPTRWRSHGWLPVGQSCTRPGLWMAQTSSFVMTRRLCVPFLTSAVTAPTVCWWLPAMKLAGATKHAELTPKTQVTQAHPNISIHILHIIWKYFDVFCNRMFYSLWMWPCTIKSCTILIFKTTERLFKWL